MSLNEQLKQQTKEFNKSNFFKFKEGESKIRILSEGAVLAQHFFEVGGKFSAAVCYGEMKGCPHHNDTDKKPSIKYSCYILDRSDNQIKLADLPYSIIKSVGDLQQDADWAFDTFPMPYDIKVIFYKKDPETGKDMAPANMYKLIASPNKVAIEQEHVEKLRSLLETANPADLVEKKKSAQLNEDQKNGVWSEPAGLSEADKEAIKTLRDREIKAREKAQEEDPDAINPNDIPF